MRKMNAISEDEKQIVAANENPTVEILDEELTFELLQSGLWKNKQLSPYDFNKNGLKLNNGRTHSIYDLMNNFRLTLNELGFFELCNPPMVESLTNIAREIDQALEEVYSSCCFEHSSAYDRFRVKTEPKEGCLFLRNNCSTHLLSELISTKTIPCRYFTILNLFQNIEGDHLNLQEHHSAELVVADINLDLTNILGIFSELFSRLNIKNIEYKPSVHPYTSPTLAACLYNELLDSWISVAEGGILRPEVCKCIQLPKDIVILRLCFSLERILLCKKGVSRLNEIIQDF